MESGRSMWLVVVGIVIGVVLIAVFIFLEMRQPQPVEAPQIQRVTLTSGDTKISVHRGGTVTFHLPQGVFQQQWDEERVRAFFAKFESQDFSAFEAYGEESGGYILTITAVDGTQRTYVLPYLEIPIPEVIEELIETIEEVINSIPTPTPTPVPTPTPIVTLPTPTPTPTPYVPSYPTPTPPPSGDGGVLQKFFECEFTDPDASQDILSQTVCTFLL